MAGPQDSKQPEQHVRGSARFFGSRRRALQTPSEALHPDEAPPPPSPRNSEKRPILSAVSGGLSLLMVVALVALVGASYANKTLSQPGPLSSDKVVFVAPGTEVVAIIDKLEKEQVIENATLLKASLWAQGKWRKVKAGEYMFKAHVSQNQVIDTLVSGKQLLHSVTVPEGLTSQQIVERLRASEVLAGDINEIPAEGSLLPDTYKVARGSSRSQLIRKMQRDQERVLDRIWAKRAKNLPLKSKYELLTLAAIVEKETGRADERTRVAAVFYNRLRKRMRLQSDPTIVYGLVGGKGTLGRGITRAEITKPTAYNTYVIPGLPPGPIANPGLAALEAVANPSQTDDLYFVANGTGGHSFASTLADHNRNVARWRQIERDRKEAASNKPENGAAGQPADVDRVAPDEQAEPVPAGRRRGGYFEMSPFGGATATAAAPGEGNGGLLAQRLAVEKALSAVMIASHTKLRVMALGPAGLAPDETQPGNSAQKAISAALGKSSIQAPAAKPDKASNPLPAAVAAYAPVKPGSAGAPKPAAAAPASGPFVIGPGIDNLKIIGVTPDVTDSPLDGPLSEDDDPAGFDPSKIATLPMSPAKRAEMAARAAKYAGAQPGPTGAEPQMEPASAPNAAAPATPARPVRARRIARDASAGTRFDPLKSKGWDLNSAQVVPKLN
ncbi:MAG: endolytic transglycosylase MltG [Beijerinckiaceae bacterium]